MPENCAQLRFRDGREISMPACPFSRKPAFPVFLTVLNAAWLPAGTPAPIVGA